MKLTKVRPHEEAAELIDILFLLTAQSKHKCCQTMASMWAVTVEKFDEHLVENQPPQNAIRVLESTGNTIILIIMLIIICICEMQAHAHRRAGGGEMLCRTCQDDAHIDRLLQTPKDKVTHFGSHFVFQLQRDHAVCKQYVQAKRCSLQQKHWPVALRIDQNAMDSSFRLQTSCVARTLLVPHFGCGRVKKNTL